MDKRRSRSAKRRIAIAEANGWICYLSGKKIDPLKDKWDVEHPIPFELGGSDKDEDLRPVLRDPHKIKTKSDVKRIAKARRTRAKHLGAKKRKSRPIPGSRDTRFKRKMDGSVEYRW